MRAHPFALALLWFALGCSHATPASNAPLESAAFTTRVSGTGRPIIFIGDLQAPGEVWDTTVAHLGGTFETHVVEIAGFAGNPRVAGPLLPQLRDQLLAYVRDRKLNKPILVGHLFGATVAYLMAMTAPDLVGGVIAIDAPPSRGLSNADETADAEEGRRALAGADPTQFAAMTTRRLGSMMRDQAVAKRLAQKAALSSPSVVAEAFFDTMTRDVRPDIPKIHAPVLVLLTLGNVPEPAWSDVEHAYGDQLAAIPHHELVVVKESKHYLMFDAPELFFASLDRFLAKA